MIESMMHIALYATDMRKSADFKCQRQSWNRSWNPDR